MPLLYYARQSQLKTKDGVKQWHLTLKKVGRAVSLQQLGEMVAEKCSATPGDVHNVIRRLLFDSKKLWMMHILTWTWRLILNCRGPCAIPSSFR